MQRRIVGQFRRRADPDVDAAVVDLLAEIAAELDRAQFDRTIGFVIAADEIRHLAEHRLLRDFLRGELLRRRHVRHLVLMIERAGSSAWNDTMIEKIALPCWIAVTRRVE